MYEDIALYYDLIHADLIDDVTCLLNNFAPDEGELLLLGCGTGRAIWPLARAGFTVVGLDNSPAMLSRARAHLQTEPAAIQRRITLVNADMRAFTFDHAFGLAVALNNTFMHLQTADLRQTLAEVRRGLREGGTLYIDLINPIILAVTPDEPHPLPEQELIDPQNGDKIVQSSSNWLDEATQTLHIHWIYERVAANGRIPRSTINDEQYHYHFPHQWETILQELGFALTKMSGDYDGTPFTESSPRLLLQASRSS